MRRRLPRPDATRCPARFGRSGSRQVGDRGRDGRSHVRAVLCRQERPSAAIGCHRWPAHPCRPADSPVAWRASTEGAPPMEERPKERRTHSVKAYLKESFLKSGDARPLRILAEYAEPKGRFDYHKIDDTIVFMGSARLIDRLSRPRTSCRRPSAAAATSSARVTGSPWRATTRMHALLARRFTGSGQGTAGPGAPLRGVHRRQSRASRRPPTAARRRGPGPQRRAHHRHPDRGVRQPLCHPRGWRCTSTTFSCASSGSPIWPRRCWCSRAGSAPSMSCSKS
ncbi:MAG: hypothetical protein MZV70_39570 [Desulfobacterales bacterium]|nr:hypothetical protein [Desulfobacterales bacterium]